MQAVEQEYEPRITMSAVYLHHQQQHGADSSPRHGGSTMNHRVTDRSREKDHVRLYYDYFCNTSTYTEAQFCRKFQMRRSLFLSIEEAITAHDNYFIQRTDDRSHLFEDLAEGRGPEVRYTVNGHEYNMGFYLDDGRYPYWPTFVKTISKPLGNKKQYFLNAQKSLRKDVERAFGVLQYQFAMIRGPSRFWDVSTVKYFVIACIIC
ncbi:uncharacterized protein LOC141719188 [Apium graveolens]|uniref:uncharacterized protein LOC141719188 n=1 Tax=Apium graveolens TaxID=4045 RepID=UPI003D791919